MKKLIFLAFMLFLTTIVFTKNIFAAENKLYRKINFKEAIKLIEENKDLIIIDVREKAEYEDGHIKNAISLPLGKIYKNELDILANKNQLIMVYCRSGRRSKEAAKILIKEGYTNIVDFGGINNWKGEIVK